MNAFMPRKAFDPSAGVKRCPRCKKSKPLSDYFKSSWTIHGYGVYCKTCAVKKHGKWRKKNLPRLAEHSRKWREANPRLAKDHKLRVRYGVPLGTYDRLLAEQSGRCAICGTDQPNGKGDFHIDHVKDTKIIRSLLCHHCNLGIGHFQHEPRILTQAVEYLNKFR